MNADRIASAFVEARRDGGAVLEYPGNRPQTLADAYAMQDSALRLWDRPVGGWKVGKINAPEDAQLGANRLTGPVFADLIFEAGDVAIDMPVFAPGFAAAEAEFMLRLAPPAALAALPRNDEDTLAWVDDVRIGIEIASSPYAGINADGPCVTVSDHGNNMGIVLGPPVPREQWDKLGEIEVTLEIGGEAVGSATTVTMLDGALGAIRFLLTNLNDRGIDVKSGWWISSGAITGVHPVKPGDMVHASFAGIGIVDAAISRFEGSPKPG